MNRIPVMLKQMCARLGLTEHRYLTRYIQIRVQ